MTNLFWRALPVTAALLIAGCGDDPLVVPVRNLERPTDMAFACVQVQDTTLTGQPMSECHPPNAMDPTTGSGATRDRGTFGFVTNSARGELAVVDLDTNRLVDLDPTIPGFNMVPVGALPEDLDASQDGCQLVTANRGSCDLTVLRPGRLLRSAFAKATSVAEGGGAVAETVVVRTPRGPLRARPQQVSYLPLPETQRSTNLSCKADSVSGTDTARPWRALVTFPSCDLVALVELPSGQLISSVYLRPEGVVAGGNDPVCPVECGEGAVAVEPDAGASSPDTSVGGPSTDDGGAGDAAAPGGVQPAGPLRVGPVAILPDGSRAYIGASGAPFVAAVTITEQGLVPVADGGRIPLADGAGGVTNLRLSVDPFKPTADNKWLGRFVGPGEFLYAFARDGSVRVIDVAGYTRAGQKERECETNFVRVDDQLTCHPVGSVTRRPLAQGPGIRIPSSDPAAQPLPRDISFGDFRAGAETQSLAGAYGMLLASNGGVYAVHLESQTTLAESPTTYNPIHTIRAVTDPARGGGAPIVQTPTRAPLSTDVPFPNRVTLGPAQGPVIESPRAERGPLAIHFPDPGVVIPQRWSVVWEGVVQGTERRTASFDRAASPFGTVIDVGADFCDRGVVAGDVVGIKGCLQDADCNTGQDEVCQQASPGAAGLCANRRQPRDQARLERCARQLGSRRRYEVAKASQGRLELTLKLDELPKTSLDTCVTNEDCQPSDAYRPQPGVMGDVGFQCLAVREGEPRRCVKPCALQGQASDRACRLGFVCEQVPGTAAGVGPLCVEAPPPDPTCLPQPLAFRVQAGNSFLVTGTATSSYPAVREQSGECRADANGDPRVTDRIPLSAPACPAGVGAEDTSQVVTRGRDPAAAGFVNPCLYKATNPDEAVPPADGSGASGQRPLRTKALFENTQLRFVLSNLDQYGGDGLALRFDVQRGLVPLTADFPDFLYLTLGTRILTGPTKIPSNEMPSADSYRSVPYIYVVDQGRSSTPGSRGQILRMNPQAPSGRPQFDSADTRFPFQIQ